jgi:hypothetical protein
LFPDHKPCNIASDVAFANRLINLPPKVQLEPGSPREHRDQHRKELDSVSNAADPESVEDLQSSQEQQIDELFTANIAFKTLQIMGQILRNFPGSLRGETKLEITKESYLLGLRGLNAVVKIIDQHIDSLREFLGHVVLEGHDSKSEESRARKTDSFLYMLTLLFSCGIIKHVSQAVGSEHLKATYKDVLQDNSENGVALIDISVKIDHFGHFPEKEIAKLYERLEGNPFALNILRILVRDHLYLYNVNVKTRQRICHKLQIDAFDPKMLTRREKKS